MSRWSDLVSSGLGLNENLSRVVHSTEVELKRKLSKATDLDMIIEVLVVVWKFKGVIWLFLRCTKSTWTESMTDASSTPLPQCWGRQSTWFWTLELNSEMPHSPTCRSTLAPCWPGRRSTQDATLFWLQPCRSVKTLDSWAFAPAKIIYPSLRRWPAEEKFPILRDSLWLCYIVVRPRAILLGLHHEYKSKWFNTYPSSLVCFLYFRCWYAKFDLMWWRSFGMSFWKRLENTGWFF